MHTYIYTYLHIYILTYILTYDGQLHTGTRRILVLVVQMECVNRVRLGGGSPDYGMYDIHVSTYSPVCSFIDVFSFR